MKRLPSIRSFVIVHDLCMIALAWGIAWFARFNFSFPPPHYLGIAARALPVVMLVQAALAWHFRLYRGLWRFASLRDLSNILVSAGLGALAIGVCLFVLTRLEGVPRSVLLFYPLFLTLTLGGPRLMYRIFKDRSLSLRPLAEGERVIVVGAGVAGEMLLRDLLREGTHNPVGLVDDRTNLARMRIHGVPVLGTLDDLPRLTENLQVNLLLIAIPSATNQEMQRIVSLCEQSGRPFRTLPRM